MDENPVGQPESENPVGQPESVVLTTVTRHVLSSLPTGFVTEIYLRTQLELRKWTKKAKKLRPPPSVSTSSGLLSLAEMVFQRMNSSGQNISFNPKFHQNICCYRFNNVYLITVGGFKLFLFISNLSPTQNTCLFTDGNKATCLSGTQPNTVLGNQDHHCKI